MARPIPYDTYMINIDETETVYPGYRQEEIVNHNVFRGVKSI